MNIIYFRKSKRARQVFAESMSLATKVKQKSLKHANMSLHDFELPLKIRHNDSMACGQGILLFECLKWSK